MAAGDVAGFVGDDADDLQRIVRLFQHAGIDEDILAAGDEGVQLRAVDQDDVDIVGVQAGGDPDRGAEGSQRLLDLCIAEEWRNTLGQRRRGKA